LDPNALQNLIIHLDRPWHFNCNSEPKGNCFVNRSALIALALYLNGDRCIKASIANTRIAPSPGAISRMEETFTWLTWLEPDDARIVWLRAENVPWKPICWRVGLSRKTAWQRWVAALITVSNRLSTASKRTTAKHNLTGIAANHRIQRREVRANAETNRTAR
jgi:Domain of unknown function (DUF6362)